MRALVLAGVVAFGWWGAAQASYIVTYSEGGGNVQASGTGTLNVTGLSRSPSTLSASARVLPGAAAETTGATAGRQRWFDGRT